MAAKVMPQSFLFPKEEWTLTTARRWLKAHGKKYGKVDAKAQHYRFRQFDPKLCKSYGTKLWKSSGGTVKVIFCRRKVSK
jgi:hypothetical protein